MYKRQTQHGWGLDQSFWDNYKVEFQKNGWHWQDNERGYFSKNVNQSKWIKNNLNDQIKMVLCHSLGFHLIEENLLDEASHVVFINSFNNFLPSSKKRNFIYRSLKSCLLYTSDAADEEDSVDLGGRRIIKKNNEWGINLLMSSQKWKKEILGNFSYPVKGESQILSIIVGQEEKAILLQEHLEKNGFLAIAIRPPTVPVNESRIRLTIRRDLNLEILKNFTSVLKTFK